MSDEDKKKRGFSWFGLRGRKAKQEMLDPSPAEDTPAGIAEPESAETAEPETPPAPSLSPYIASVEHDDTADPAPEIPAAPQADLRTPDHEPGDAPPAERESENIFADAALADESQADESSGPAEEAPEAEDPQEEPKKKGFFARMKAGLSRSTSALSDGITGIFTKAKLDDETLEELEDLLITADLGVEVSGEVTKELAKTRYNKAISPAEVREALAGIIAKRIEPVAKSFILDPALKPHVVLVVGVNGTGKTTTIGKLAHRFRGEGKSVMMAAGDTFRAAAIDQLKIWGERTKSPVIARDVGADAAGLAFDALQQAREEGHDVLLIDTAGRLQNKQGLMEELAKVTRVLKKQNPDAPHSVLLVLDATTGQNAVSQVEVFKDVAGVTGLVMTKLDGTARGGILVALAAKFGLPIHAIGVGEGIEDFQPFDPEAFAKALTGADTDGAPNA